MIVRYEFHRNNKLQFCTENDPRKQDKTSAIEQKLVSRLKTRKKYNTNENDIRISSFKWRPL